MKIGFLSISVLIAGLSACSSVYQPGMVARDWSCKISELKIQPLFPPREDVQVGDVYVRVVPQDVTAIQDCQSSLAMGFSLPRANSDFGNIPLFIATLPVNTEVNKHYAGRIDLPKTEQSQLSVVAGAISVNGYTTAAVSDGLLKNSRSTSQPTDFKRLRVVGFPDFMVVKVSSTDLGAILPALGIPADIGLSANSVESASISIPVAESYAVPAPIVMEKMKLTLFGEDHNSCKIYYDDIYNQFGNKTLEGNELAISGIFEVYYTRAISVNITLKQSGAFGLNRDGSGAAAGQQSNTPSAPTAAASAATGAPAPQEGSPAEAARADLTRAITAAGEALAKRKGLPGVTIEVGTSSAATIGMTRVFDRPIAIGYRAVNYKLKSDDKNCLTSGQLIYTGLQRPAFAPSGHTN